MGWVNVREEDAGDQVEVNELVFHDVTVIMF